MCVNIVPLDWWDYVSGRDLCCQGSAKAIKTADGRYWEPANLTPMQATIAGVRLGYIRGDKICER